jgi:hypothetical protein
MDRYAVKFDGLPANLKDKILRKRSKEPVNQILLQIQICAPSGIARKGKRSKRISLFLPPPQRSSNLSLFVSLSLSLSLSLSVHVISFAPFPQFSIPLYTKYTITHTHCTVSAR